MSCGTTRANQHAGKGVSGTWLPMRAFKRVCGRGLKPEFGDVVALK